MTMPDEQTKALIDAARRDRLTFQILLREPASPVESTLFHAQQAVEKGVKAKLVQAGIIFPRTHDLLQLFDLATVNSLAVPVVRDLMARLGPYAVEFRYLGVIAPEVSLDEAKVAVESVMIWLAGERKG
jgi:HEPN domain-containing protein